MRSGWRAGHLAVIGKAERSIVGADEGRQRATRGVNADDSARARGRERPSRLGDPAAGTIAARRLHVTEPTEVLPHERERPAARADPRAAGLVAGDGMLRRFALIAGPDDD